MCARFGAVNRWATLARGAGRPPVITEVPQGCQRVRRREVRANRPEGLPRRWRAVLAAPKCRTRRRRTRKYRWNSPFDRRSERRSRSEERRVGQAESAAEESALGGQQLRVQ